MVGYFTQSAEVAFQPVITLTLASSKLRCRLSMPGCLTLLGYSYSVIAPWYICDWTQLLPFLWPPTCVMLLLAHYVPNMDMVVLKYLLLFFAARQHSLLCRALYYL